jgi:hypothetical protein
MTASCHRHPDRLTTRRCTVCENHFCTACLKYDCGKPYCEGCVAEGIKMNKILAANPVVDENAPWRIILGHVGLLLGFLLLFLVGFGYALYGGKALLGTIPAAVLFALEIRKVSGLWQSFLGWWHDRE